MTQPLSEVCVEIFLRTAIIVFSCGLAMRLWGKRGWAQLTLYDLAALSAMANAVQNGMTKGSGRLSVGIVAGATLIGGNWILSRLFHASPGFEKAVTGVPRILVRNGEVLHKSMACEHITQEELDAALRSKGLSGVPEARLVVLETDGTFSVVTNRPRTTRAGARDGHTRDP